MRRDLNVITFKNNSAEDDMRVTQRNLTQDRSYYVEETTFIAQNTLDFCLCSTSIYDNFFGGTRLSYGS